MLLGTCIDTACYIPYKNKGFKMPFSKHMETPSAPQTVCTPPPTDLCTYMLFSCHSPWPSFTWSTSVPTVPLNTTENC